MVCWKWVKWWCYESIYSVGLECVLVLWCLCHMVYWKCCCKDKSVLVCVEVSILTWGTVMRWDFFFFLSVEVVEVSDLVCAEMSQMIHTFKWRHLTSPHLITDLASQNSLPLAGLPTIYLPTFLHPHPLLYPSLWTSTHLIIKGRTRKEKGYSQPASHPTFFSYPHHPPVHLTSTLFYCSDCTGGKEDGW